MISLERRIVCAALRNAEGQLVLGPRHYDHTMRMQIINDTDWNGCEQGFINTWVNF